MIQTIYGYDCSKWVAQRIPHMHGNFVNYSCLTFVDDVKKRIVAGAVFTDRNDYNLLLHIAIDDPKAVNKRCMGDGFHYIFNICGCVRATSLVAVDNVKSIKLTEHLGFKREGLVRKGLGDVDAYLYGILREEAEPWLRSATCRPEFVKNSTITA